MEGWVGHQVSCPNFTKFHVGWVSGWAIVYDMCSLQNVLVISEIIYIKQAFLLRNGLLYLILKLIKCHIQMVGTIFYPFRITLAVIHKKVHLKSIINHEINKNLG